ncbi:hypothetical protein TIFTF001_010474 [Ficus carica]|uniref:Uncharacterized protein n=1 Tax=Ficus carica TaxID=3494 RepID=A0AA88ACA3_FICCA|nr:hypothetical protein TIFTF001_010474 [Ficus carica]
MALSPKSVTGTSRSFLSRKPRMRVILRSQFHRFEFISTSEDDDLVDEADLDAHLHDGDEIVADHGSGDDYTDYEDDADADIYSSTACIGAYSHLPKLVGIIRDIYMPIGLDQPFEFNATEVDFFEDDIANDETVPVSDDSDHHEVADVADNETEALTLESSPGTYIPPLKRKPRMRVIPPSQFKRFKFTSLTEVDDLVDEAYLDAHLHDDDEDDVDQFVADEIRDDTVDMAAEDDTDQEDESEALSLEESTGTAHIPSLQYKPRMRVIPPSQFKRFEFTVSEADDFVDEADLDAQLNDGDSKADGYISSADFDDNFQEDDQVSDDDGYDDIYARISADHADHDYKDDGYTSDSSHKSSATSRPSKCSQETFTNE